MLRSCTVAVLTPSERTGHRLEACFGLSRTCEIHTGAAFLKVSMIRKRRVVYVIHRMSVRIWKECENQGGTADKDYSSLVESNSTRDFLFPQTVLTQ